MNRQAGSESCRQGLQSIVRLNAGVVLFLTERLIHNKHKYGNRSYCLTKWNIYRSVLYRWNHICKTKHVLLVVPHSNIESWSQTMNVFAQFLNFSMVFNYICLSAGAHYDSGVSSLTQILSPSSLSLLLILFFSLASSPYWAGTWPGGTS